MNIKIQEFIDYFHSTKTEVIGAVLFGSTLKSGLEKSTDIDLFLVLKTDHVYRGNFYLNKRQRIDYFASGIRLIEDHFDVAKGTLDSLHLHVFGTGKIIAGHNEIKHLTRRAKEQIKKFKYIDRQQQLDSLWYKLYDSYEDAKSASSGIAFNYAVSNTIITSIQFYAILNNKLFTKGGIEDSGKFEKLHKNILKSDKESTLISLQILIDYLLKRSRKQLNSDWEVRYK